MNFWNTLAGEMTVTMTSAEPGRTLHILNEHGMTLRKIEQLEDLTVRFQCRRRERKRIQSICRKHGADVRFSRETGLGQLVKKMICRPVLTAGCLLLLTMTVVLPTRVLFFQVEGNETIPARQILEAAAECGIRFGVSRREIRSEKMKNTLLGAMPELKWAGINTAGCRGIISVRERGMLEETTASGIPGNIVAVRDAYVTHVTATRGSLLCAPGQVVKEGQVLISGFTDLGRLMQVTRAEGEIFGETSRQIRTLTPAKKQKRADEGDIQWRFSLIFGKKRINFGKGSGISPHTCGRMYQEYNLTLPGGFQLPVTLALDVAVPWETTLVQASPEEVTLAMAAFSREQILRHTVSGRILNETLDFSEAEEVLCMDGVFLCSEMIGRVSTNDVDFQ